MQDAAFIIAYVNTNLESIKRLLNLSLYGMIVQR